MEAGEAAIVLFSRLSAAINVAFSEMVRTRRLPRKWYGVKVSISTSELVGEIEPENADFLIWFLHPGSGAPIIVGQGTWIFSRIWLTEHLVPEEFASLLEAIFSFEVELVDEGAEDGPPVQSPRLL
jgi:hypothetical protein